MPRPWSRVSATQLKVAQLCPRKWWYERVSDLPPIPPTAAMLQGKAIHEQVEAWLKEGTRPTDARAAALALQYPAGLIRTSPHVHSEREVDLHLELPVPLLGFVDLLDARALPHTVEVVDFKTTSGWQYAKTTEELQEDLQMVPYARWVLEQYRPNAVQVTHVVVHKETCEVATTSAMLTPAHVRSVWSDTIVPLAHSMASWATAPAPQAVPAVPGACSAFGGCPYASACDRGGGTTTRPFGAMSRIRSSTVPQPTDGATPMSRLQELIRARSLAAASNSPPPGPAPKPPAHVTTSSTSLEDAQQRVQEARARLARAEAGGDPLPTEAGLAHAVEAAGGPPAPVVEATTAPAPARSRADSYAAARASVLTAAGGRDFVPVKELRLLIGAELGLARVAWSHVEETCIGAMPGWELEAAGLQAVAPVEAQVVDEPVDTQQYADTAARASVEPATIVEAPAVAPVEAPVVAPVQSEAPQHGFLLLVDVGVVQAPQGWKLQTLEAYLAPIVARYEASVGGPAFLRDFRAGERTVAHMASLDLPADGTVLLVDSGNSVWKEVSQALVPRAAGILRGLR